MLCIRLVLFAQNRVSTWFIGCMRFGVDGDAAAAAAVIVIVSVWFLMPRYVCVFVCTQILWSTTANIQLSSHNAFFRSITFHHHTQHWLSTPFALWTNSCWCSIWWDSIRYDICYVKVCVWVCLYLRYITPKSIFIAKSLHMFSIHHRLEITLYSSFSSE